MSKKYRALPLCLIVCILYSPEVNAVKQPNQEGFFELELFSLSKSIESAFDAPAAVYIITAEDIRRSGATTIPDALRIVPGIEVAQLGSHKWAIGARGFNFQFTNKLLVLIDGRSVYTPLFAGTFWDVQDVLLENIDKIEVIRGPGATVWGANAVNGVINIITKNGASTQGKYVSGTISNSNDRILEGRHGGKFGKDAFHRSYVKLSDWESLDTTSKQKANDEWQNALAGIRLDWNDIDGDTFSLHSDARKGVAENYFSILPTLETPFTKIQNNEKTSHGANIVAKWDHVINKDSKITSQVYLDYDYVDITVVGRDAYTLDLDFQHVLDWREDDQFIWGLGYRYILDSISLDDVIVNYRKLDRHTKLYSAFLQNKFSIIQDRLYLTAGSKIEYHSYTGLENQPSVKAVYFPDDNQTLWASITRAVRTPSRGEIDATIRVLGTTSGYVANRFESNFNSEKLLAYEVGYRIEPTDTLLLETTAFFNEYDDFRTFEPGVLTPEDDIASFLILDNKGSSKVYGAEVNAKYRVSDNWRVQGSYSLLTVETDTDPSSADGLLRFSEGQSPSQQLKLQSFWNITSNIEFDNNLYYIDDLPDAGLSGADAYTRFDTRISWRPMENLEISILGKDLLDNRHKEFQQSLYSPEVEVNRGVYFKVSWEF